MLENINFFQQIEAKGKTILNYHIIVQLFHQYEDASLALWALFST